MMTRRFRTRMRSELVFASLLAFLVLSCRGEGPPATPHAPPAVVIQPASLTLRAGLPDPLAEPPKTTVAPWTRALRQEGAAPRLVVPRSTTNLTSAAFSVDGKLIVGVLYSGEAVVWDATTGVELNRIRLDLAVGLASVRVVDEGRHFILLDEGTVWDTLSGKQITIVRRPVAWTDDGTKVLTACDDSGRNDCLVDWRHPANRVTMPAGDGRALSGDGSRVVLFLPSSLRPPKVTIVDASNGRALRDVDARDIPPDLPRAASVFGPADTSTRFDDLKAALSQDGRRLVLANAGVAMVFDANTGALLAKLGLGVARLNALALVDNGRVLYAAGTDASGKKPRHEAHDVDKKTLRWSDSMLQDGILEDGTLRAVVNEAGLQTLVEIDVSSGARRSIGQLRADESLLAAHPSGAAIVLTNFDGGGGSPTLLAFPSEARHPLSGRNLLLSGLAATATGRILLSADEGSRDTALLFDLQSGEIVFRDHTPHSAAVGWDPSVVSPDGGWVSVGNTLLAVGNPRASQSFDGAILAIGKGAEWVLTTSAMLRRQGAAYRSIEARIPHTDTPISKLSVANVDGSVIGSPGPGDDIVYMWDGETGNVLWHLPLGPHRSESTLAFNEAGTKVAIAGSDSFILASPAPGTPAYAHLLHHPGESFIVSYEARTGQELGRLPDTEPFRQSLTWSKEGLLTGISGMFTDLTVVNEKGQQVCTLSKEGGVSGVAFLPFAGFGATTARDGTVRIWDIKNRREAATIMFFENGRWLAVDPAGRFDTNRLERLDDVFWSLPNEPFTLLPFESLMRDYFRPGLLRRILAREELEAVGDIGQLNVVLPEVSIEEVIAGAAGLDVRVRVRDAVGTSVAGTQVHALPRDVRLFRDGRLVGRQPAELGGSADVRFQHIAVPSSARKVELTAYAFNSANVKSVTTKKEVSLEVHAPPRRARAFVVAMGVDAYGDPSLDLAFASADAELLGSRLQRALGGTFEETSLVLAGRARGDLSGTSNAFVSALRRLGGVAEGSLAGVSGVEALQAATPDDVVVVTFAGHGTTSADGHFQLLFGDYDGERKGTLDDLRLAAEMAAIDAREIVFVIDACQSGASIDAGGFKPGPLGAKGFGQLAYDKKMRVLAASQAADVALEDSTHQHGLLTYALGVEGLGMGAADFAPADGKILLSEWLAYGARRVPALAEGILAKPASERGVKRVQVTRNRGGLTQEPRLFDDPERPSEVVLAR